MYGNGPMPGAGAPGQMWAAPTHAGPWWSDPLAMLTVVLLAALIAVVVWGVLRMTNTRAQLLAAAPAPSHSDEAGQALRLRYARGDISREDYLARGADLGLVPPGPMPEAPPSQE